MPSLPRATRKLRLAAILLGCLLIILAPVFFYGRTLTPIATEGVLPTGAYGYHGGTPQLQTTRDPVGAVATDFAEWAYVDRALGAGEIPFWNPSQGLGRPLLAEQWAGVFFPVSLLRHALPTAYWDLVGVANLLLVAIFLAMLGRVLGLRPVHALFIGVGTFACGSFQVYLPVITIVAGSAWLPLLLYGVERAHRKPDSRLRGLPVLVATYALGTAGHGTPAIFAVAFLALYVAVRCWQEPRMLRTLLALMPYLAGGALLAAPQWVQFVQYVVTTNAEMLLTHRSDAFAIYRPWHLPAIFFPYLYGPLNLPHPLGISSLSLGEYWGLGWLPAAVAFPALVGTMAVVPRGPPQFRAMLIAAGLMTLWAVGVPPFSWLSNLPILWRLNFNYFWLLVHIVLLVHAGYGLACLARADAAAWRRAIVAWFVFCAVMLAIAFGFVAYQVLVAGRSAGGFGLGYLVPGLGAGLAWAIAVPLCLRAARLMAPASRSPFHWLAICGVVLSAIAYFPYAAKASVDLARWGALAAYLAISAATLIVWRRGWPRCRRWGWALLPPVGMGLTYVSTVMNPGLPPRLDPMGAAPFVKVLQERAASGRVYGIGGYLTSNFSGAFGLHAANILTPLIPAQPLRFVQFFLDHHQHAGAFFGMSGLGRFVPADPVGQLHFSRRLWDYLGVRYIVLDGDLDERIVVAPLDSISLPGIQAAQPTPLPPDSPGKPGWWDARVACNDGAFDRVDVMLSTYGRTNPGKVVLQAVTPEGAVFTETGVDAAKLVDNAFQRFDLPRLVCKERRGTMLLRLGYRAQDRNHAVAFWLPANGGGFVYRRVGPAPVKIGASKPFDFRPIPLTGTVAVPVRCSGVPVAAMEFRLSTFDKINPGRVALTFRAADGSGPVLARSVIDSATVVDNGMARFPLSASICNTPEEVLLAQLTHESATGGALAYWHSPSIDLVEHAMITGRNLGFAPIYADPQTGAKIWENLHAQARVYLAPEFGVSPKWEEAMQDFVDQEDLRRTAFGERGGPVCPSNPGFHRSQPPAKMQRIAVGPNSVDAEFEAHTAGTLVVTDNYMPGWRATVNGKDQAVQRVNGTFRGVCIPAPGRYQVSWRYRPPLWDFSLWMAAFGALLAAAAFARQYARRQGSA